MKKMTKLLQFGMTIFEKLLKKLNRYLQTRRYQHFHLLSSIFQSQLMLQTLRQVLGAVVSNQTFPKQCRFQIICVTHISQTPSPPLTPQVPKFTVMLATNKQVHICQQFVVKSFKILHGLAHPRTQTTKNLISDRYVWPNLKFDVQNVDAIHRTNIKSFDFAVHRSLNAQTQLNRLCTYDGPFEINFKRLQFW